MDTGRQPDLTHEFPRDLYYQIVHELRDALPPPVTGSPEDRVRRDNAMIAQVASLLPAHPDEVVLATQFVAANAQALDCLRLARRYPNDVAHVLKCTAQSASMMRQSRGALGQLLRLQSTREKRDKNDAARDRAATIEREAVSLLGDALDRAPSAPASDDQPRALTEADKYALANPSSAALIRSLGRLPKKFAGDPPSPELVHAIVNGGSPILQALVRKPAHQLATAA